MMVIVNIEDYPCKITTLLEDPASRRLDKHFTEAVDRKTSALNRMFSMPEEVTELLQPRGLRLPRLYGLPKIHKEGICPRSIVSTIDQPTYGLKKHLAGLLGSQLGQLQHHVKNSDEFVCTLNTLRVSPEDILVSFNVIMLFRVPLRDAVNLLS
jgi:hypothetical protein